MLGEEISIRWARRRLGCLAALAFGAFLLLLPFAFDPGFAIDDGTRSGQRILALTGWSTAGGVNWAALALGLVLAWACFSALWRLVDPAALRANAAGIGFHPVLRRRARFWHEVESIRFDAWRTRYGIRVPSLVVRLRDPASKPIRLTPVESEGLDATLVAIARLREASR